MRVESSLGLGQIRDMQPASRKLSFSIVSQKGKVKHVPTLEHLETPLEPRFGKLILETCFGVVSSSTSSRDLKPIPTTFSGGSWRSRECHITTGGRSADTLWRFGTKFTR